MTGRVGRRAGEWAMRRWIVMLARSAARAACRSLALPLEPLRVVFVAVLTCDGDVGCAVLALMLAVVMVKVEVAVLGRRRGACGGAFHLRVAPRPSDADPGARGGRRAPAGAHCEAREAPARRGEAPAVARRRAATRRPVAL